MSAPDPTAGEPCGKRRHLLPHAEFGDDLSGNCGCAGCDGCLACSPATPDATASRWCGVHDEPAAECWSDECLMGASDALTDDEKKSLHPHAGDWAGFHAAVERIARGDA